MPSSILIGAILSTCFHVSQSLCTSNCPTTPPPTATCPSWQTYTNMELCKTSVSNYNWNTAKAYCEGLGSNATLATIYNYQEFSDVLTAANYVQNSPPDQLIWLGYTDSVTEGIWQPVNTGAPKCFDLFYWPTEPSDDNPNSSYTEDCLGFYTGFPRGGIADVSCDGSQKTGPAVCQRRTSTPGPFPSASCAPTWTAAGQFCYKQFGTATFDLASCPCGSTLPIMKCAQDYDAFVSAYWNVAPQSSFGAAWLNIQKTTSSPTYFDLTWRSTPPEKIIYHRLHQSDGSSLPTGERCYRLVRRAAPSYVPSGTFWDSTGCSDTPNVICQAPGVSCSLALLNSSAMLAYGSLVNSPDGAIPTCTVTYNCASLTSYMRTGLQQTRTFTCQANTSWTGGVMEPCEPTCSPISPTAHLQINNTGILSISYRYLPNDVVKFSCDTTSYYVLANTMVINATSTIRCLANGTWSVPPASYICKNTCAVPTATPPLNYTIPQLMSNGRILEGTSINTSYCTNTTNYFLAGVITPVCLSNGTWNSNLLACSPKCPPITTTNLDANALNAVYSDNINYRSNSNVTFSCRIPNFSVLIGSSVAYCDGSTFSWNGTLPYCQPTCPVPTGVVQPLVYTGNATGPAGTYIGPTSIKFSCNASSTVLVGQDSATCSTNGSWSAFPTCAGQCPMLQNSPDLDINYADSQRKVNSSVKYSCKNGAKLTGSQSATCDLDKTWKPSDVPKCEETKESAAITTAKIVIQTLGCSFLIGAAAIAIGVTLLLRDFSIECLLHMSQDIAIIFGHVLILTLRDRTDPWELCTTVAAMLQFAFTALFIFLTIEAMHSYTILSNVLNGGALLSRKALLITGWAVPTLYTACTAGIFYKEYALSYACWLNWGNTTVAALTMGPIILCSTLTIVCTEAGGSYRKKALPLIDKHQLFAARVNQNAMWFLISGHWVSWFLGSYAIYSVNVAWIAPVFVANVILGVMIFLFHVMGSPQANKLVRGWCQRCCGKKRP